LNLIIGSALLRGSLFFVRKKSNQKKRTPGSRAGGIGVNGNGTEPSVRDFGFVVASASGPF